MVMGGNGGDATAWAEASQRGLRGETDEPWRLEASEEAERDT
ncbi:MAG: hypothetical protein ACLR3C_04170 [Eggerthella lenta]